jgi:hypothetical protein
VRNFSFLALFPMLLVAGCAAEETGDTTPDVAPVLDTTEPQCCGTPSNTVNFRVYPQIVVRWPGSNPAYIVPAGGAISVPCATTTIYMDLWYLNDGNTTSAAHQNQFFWGGSLAPQQTHAQLGLAPSVNRLDTFTWSVASSTQNIPYLANFRVDSPSAVNEVNELDNSVTIRVTRSCP